MAVAEHVRGIVAEAPLIKTGWKSGCPRRGVGKGTFLIRQEGLPKQILHHKKSQVM
jgi:hypothetical protein